MDMTVGQYKDWVCNARFEITDHIDGETEFEKPCGYDDDDSQERFETRTRAYASRDAKTTAPNGDKVEVIYQRSVEWVGDRRGRFEDNYEDSDVEGSAETWAVTGLTLLDEDGDKLATWERNEVLAETLGADHPFIDITDIDFEALLPPVVTEDIDLWRAQIMDEGLAMIMVSRDGEPDLRFTGREVASVRSSDERARSDYSGSTGRWTVLRLYETAGGKFIAQSIGKTRWQGEHDRYSATVCANHAEVIAFFGHGWLAKELYEESGIDDVEDVN